MSSTHRSKSFVLEDNITVCPGSDVCSREGEGTPRVCSTCGVLAGRLVLGFSFWVVLGLEGEPVRPGTP